MGDHDPAPARPVDALGAIRRLERLVAHVARLGSDGRWMALALQRYIGSAGAIGLEEALGLGRDPGERAWWTRQRLAERDRLIRLLAVRLTRDGEAPAAAVARELHEYETRAWPRDRAAPGMPTRYRGTPRELVYGIFALDVRVPTSPKWLARILAHEEN